VPRGKVLRQRAPSGSAERYNALFSAFAHHDYDFGAEIYLIEPQANQFRDPQPAAISNFQHRPVSQAAGSTYVDRAQQQLYFFGAESAWQRTRTRKEFKISGGVLLQNTLIQQKPDKAPHCGQAAALAGNRKLTHGKVLQVGGHHAVIQLIWRDQAQAAELTEIPQITAVCLK
jgi:hypothetical protein